ncbi:capsid cement protein [Salinicola endophyticus]|uniref:Capsid cement protein n=1 Tax=Salinicola endophyticus TaxID=1949083 RepID=A0AB74UCL8_9GAMM
MAKNYNGDGQTVTLPAPAGGVIAGLPVVIGSLVLVPLDNAAEGEDFVGVTGGEWGGIPCDDALALGARVAMLEGEMVAAGTASATAPIGVLTSDPAGTATVLIVQGMAATQAELDAGTGGA